MPLALKDTFSSFCIISSADSPRASVKCDLRGSCQCKNDNKPTKVTVN